MDVFFLSIDILKQKTTIDNSVEDKQLESSIIDAQSIDIQPILGTRLYESLKTKISGSTVTGIYKTLMDDYIEPTLIKFAERRSLIFLYAKIRNKSVMNQNSDNSTPVDITILDKMRREILDDAEFYSNRLKTYLIDNRNDIPEYLEYNPTGSLSNITPNQNDSFFSGIHLSSRIPCYTCGDRIT